MCEAALNLAKGKEEEINDEQYKEYNHLAELMRENITYWKTEVKP